MHFNPPLHLHHRWGNLTIAALVGLFGTFVCWINNPNPSPIHDMGWPFTAAHDLLAGLDPYRHEPSADYVPYPLTTMMVVLPFTPLPPAAGIALFFGLGSALLCYGLLCNGEPWRLLLFASPSFIMAAKSMQWSPLFMAVLFFPSLAWVLIAKPTLAVPVALSIPWRPLPMLIGILLSLASLAIMPDWPLRWIAQTVTYAGFVPLLIGPGLLLLLVLPLIRERHGRILAVMSILPQQIYWYDQLLLWLIPQSKRQMYIFTLISWAAFMYVLLTYRTLKPGAPYIVAGLYMPALALTLWPAVRQRLPLFIALGQVLLVHRKKGS